AGSRSSILEEFKRHGNAVLLGTNSFWEGVDIQGESLSLLILFKIPFQVPSEPIVEAFIDKLERENKDSFMHYMLPNALLKLRQGFGRLIRSRSDRGIVLIMDSRVSNKRYGEYFKQVLPTACVETKDEMALISGITRFFNSPGGGKH
ncbi:MAG: helicase C-terminal domain-containing protein, partial [Candidatus Cloacimonadaceae bacterium]|nr:helicase C-terminal domain-containing protein [Candidatus Cloacimonadaceae bacterium]